MIADEEFPFIFKIGNTFLTASFYTITPVLICF